jgi:hypothetical protein
MKRKTVMKRMWLLAIETPTAHSRVSGNPERLAEIFWVPAFAGTSGERGYTAYRLYRG